MRHAATVFAMALVVTAAGIASARTWVIRPDGTGDAPTIQAGVTAASAGDTVLVTCGIYYEHDIALKSGIHLTSETGTADCVTIDGEFGEDRLLYCSGVDSTTTIVGLTLLKGESVTNFGGGGIYCYLSCPRVISCRFQQNACYEGSGGGAYMRESSPVFTDCVFDRNDVVGEMIPRGGGGAFAAGGSPVFEGCVFCDNQSSNGYGGGLWCDEGSRPALSACLFDGNSGGAGGGGIGIGGWGSGSGPCSVEIAGCTFYGNRSGSAVGAGVWCFEDNVARLDNVIVAFSTYGSAIGWEGSLPQPPAPVLTCCDLYGNPDGDWVGYIADQYGVRGNVCVDPLFCNVATGNFHLAPDSPCLDTDSCGTYGAYGGGCEPTSSVPGSPGNAAADLSVCVTRNPVRGDVRIDFDLAIGGPLNVTIYNVRGEAVATLVDSYALAGSQSVAWNCTGADQAPVVAGVYFCRVTSGSDSAVLKLVVVR